MTAQNHQGRTSPVFRTGLTATASTLVALMAMSAVMSAAATSRTVQVETRSESHVVRAVAAAVAAAARDLFATDQSTAAGAWLDPTPAAASQIVSWATATAGTSGPASELSETLLDLPPPVC